jgi:hypothetical protein
VVQYWQRAPIRIWIRLVRHEFWVNALYDRLLCPRLNSFTGSQINLRLIMRVWAQEMQP